MKTALCILFALSLSAAVPRHIIERTPLEGRNGKVTFVDKYSDGTIDRVDVPQTIKIENKEYAVATNVSRVVCIGVVRTNTMWRMAYEVRSVDGSVKTNYNFAPVDRKELQIERKAALTNLHARAGDRKLVQTNRLSNAKGEKTTAVAKIAEEAVRVRKMKAADPVVSETVNAKGQLVQTLTNGQTRTKDLPRRASVPIAPAKKKQTEEQTGSNGTTAAAAAGGAIIGAGALAAANAKKKK